MKYNKTVSSKTVNLAGGEAYGQSPKLALTSLVLTSFMKDQFYRTEDETLAEIKSLIKQINDPLFIAKLAIYARTVYGMRSVSHVLAGEVAKLVSSKSWGKSFFDKVVYRPDDMGEILGYYFSTEKKLPHSMRKGFGAVLSRLNEYELSKYKGDGKAYSLMDIANLCHPKSTNELAKLMKGELKPAETWETKLTQAGQIAENDDQKEELKATAWKDLILEKKIGYFALLRNLRNIIEQAPDVLPQALELLTDENRIKKSLVLPFRFLTAIKEIQQLNGAGVRSVVVALSKAIDISLSNVPKLDGETLVVLDVSSSMSGKPIEIGSVFASALYKSNDADFMEFSSMARYRTLNPTDSLLSISQEIVNGCQSGGTNFHAIFEEANKAYKRIIILSDMQGWINYNTPTREFNAYKKRTGCNPFIYSFDLQGYGSMQFPEPNVFAIAGFSEKIFDTMKMLEVDKNALIGEIDKIEL